MIKIQYHLNKVNTDLYLATLTNNYWKHLNPKNKDRKYSSTALVEVCKKFYINCGTSSYVAKYAGGSPATAKRHKKFFMHLKKYNFGFLKRLIVCEPSEFEGLRGEIFTILEESDIFYRNGGKLSQTPFGTLLSEKLFKYKKFRTSPYCVQMYLDMDFFLGSCPYCNDRQVEIVKKNIGVGATIKNVAYFDLDHFYSKSLNPFFALSFYNLVPSCSVCNSKEKGDKPFSTATHIHPYLLSFDDLYKFEFSSKVLLGDTINELAIIPKTGFSYLNVTDFNLENRYNNRIGDVSVMLRYFQNYHKAIRDDNEKQMFIKYFTEANSVALEKKFILKKDRCKLHRDVIKAIDVDNLIGIID